MQHYVFTLPTPAYVFNAIIITMLITISVSCSQPATSDDDDIRIGEAFDRVSDLSRAYPDSARLLLDMLWVEYEHFSDEQRFNFYSLQGAVAMMKGKFAASENWYSKSLLIAENLNDTSRQVQTLAGIARNQTLRRETQKSNQTLRQARALLGDTEDAIQLRSIYQTLGDNFAEMAQLDSAFYYKQMALDLARSENDKGGKARNLGGMTIIFFQLGEFSRAVESSRQAISILEELNDNVNLHIELSNLSLIFNTWNRREESLLYAQKADELARTIGIPSDFEPRMYRQQGLTYLGQGNYADALSMLRQAQKLFLQLQDEDPLPLTNVKLDISRVYRQLGNYDCAVFYANKTLETAQRGGGAVRSQVALFRNLAFIHAARGDLEQFEFAMQNEVALRDSLITQQHIQAIHEMQVRYETEQKQLIIAQQEETIQHRRIQMILIIVIGVVVVLLLVITVVSLRHKAEYQQQKAENATRIVQQYEQLLGYKKEEETKRTSNANNITNKLSHDLQHLFEEEKIYRKPRLSVNDVAQQLGIGSDRLSIILNQEYQKPFSDFVNGYRIAEARDILKEQDEGGEFAHYTIQAIAKEVGFGSAVAFYSAFKNIVGVTPTEYKNVIKKMRK